MMIGALGMAAVENKLSVGYGAEAGHMDPLVAKMCGRYCKNSLVITRNEESRTVLRERFLVRHVQQVGDVIALVNLLTLVRQQLEKYIAGKERLLECDGFAAIFVHGAVTGQRHKKSLALAVVRQFLFAAGTRVRDVPEQFVRCHS